MCGLWPRECSKEVVVSAVVSVTQIPESGE